MTNPPVSRYQQVAEYLRGAIARGEYQPGQRLPSTAALAKQFGLSYPTINKAVHRVASEGLVTITHGHGTIVRESHPVRRLGPDRYAKHKWQITTVETHVDESPKSDTARQQGSQTQRVRQVEADKRIAEALQIPLGEQVYERARIVTREDVPTHTMTSYYLINDVEGTPLVDPSPGIAGHSGGYQVLTDQGLAPEQITEDLFARMPTTDETYTLALPPGEPVVEVHRTTRTVAGRVIEFARGVHVASRFVWSYTYNIPD